MSALLPAGTGRAFFLVGPTATGKTAVAHHLARTMGAAVLSADAMLVYRGMDIGTAKPAPAERQGIDYGGLDLVDPDQPFSVADYLAAAQPFLRATWAAGRPVIVAGGTGLYVKCLLHGIQPGPAANAGLRKEWEELLRVEGVPGLQRRLQQCDAARYAALADQANPRRLVRALELAQAGVPAGPSWPAVPAGAPLAGLRAAPADRDRRIRARVAAMYAAGLLDEAQGLRARYGALSATARQAIGYREAWAVLDGACARDAAMDTTASRTRRLAKRQMTWFRHQVPVAWVDVPEDAGEVAALAAQVYNLWEQHGPAQLAI